MRSEEAWQIEWTDIDFLSKKVRITAEKRSNPRVLRVSDKLLAMLNNLPKKSNRVFGSYQIRGFARSFQRQRKRIAGKLQNPRLMQISFHTFRHWKATTEYHKTTDLLYVVQLLGHRSIRNTLVYTQLVEFQGGEEYVSKVATTVEETQKLVEAGFEYVCDLDDVKIFRKRK